jgi:hypothetical protein
MSDEQFSTVNSAWMGASLAHLCDGGLIGTFIDWRGYPLVHAAASSHGLVPINLYVWTKTNGGMGSLYRSRHELFPLYKNGTAAHVNNIELGKTAVGVQTCGAIRAPRASARTAARAWSFTRR